MLIKAIQSIHAMGPELMPRRDYKFSGKFFSPQTMSTSDLIEFEVKSPFMVIPLRFPMEYSMLSEETSSNVFRPVHGVVL